MRGFITFTKVFLLVALMSVTAWASITVTVTPPTATVYTGTQQQFSAQVTGTWNQIVIWSLSGPGCYALSCGTISGSGLYTAPNSLPNPPTVTVTATSIVDGTQGTAVVTLQSANGISVSISPPSAVVQVNQQQQFTATVVGTDNKKVTWSVSGTGCVGGSCGTVDSNGLYTAPPTVPNPSFATVTATSVADPTKFASASVVITPSASINVTISPTQAQVPPNGQQQFTATVTGTDNKAVVWTVYGDGCLGAACGTISNTGLYTAPASIPNPPKVTVKVTSVADPTKYATAIVTIGTGVTVTISPPSATVALNQQQQFTADVEGTSNKIVIWNVSGAGCVGLSCGTVTSTGLYTAPAALPSPPTVKVTATLLADPNVFATASVTITSGNEITVSVTPSQATVGTGSQQQFTATVTGTDNKAVTWSITGIGCVLDTCGTIDSSGLYTAPANVPNPSFLNVVAKSVADPAKSGSAYVVVTAQVHVTVAPPTASVPPGMQQQFTATVTGTNNKAVTWSVSGPGCAGAACGTVDANGLYTAPFTPPVPPTVNVTATSQADNSKYGTAVVTVATPIVVTVSPPTATVTSGGTQQFIASVTGTDNKKVTWSVQGKGCNGAACGTIDQTGLYTAPVAVPDPPTVTVIATSQADNVSYGTAAVTLIPTANSRLHGQYAFLLKGHDPFGYPYLTAGSLTADGNGNITGGLEDINSFFGVKTAVPIIAGTYNVGGDSRGTVQIQTSLGTSTYAFALTLDGKNGSMITLDGSGILASGTLKKQDPNAFNAGALAGGFAVGLSGSDLSGGRIGILALLYPSGSGYIAGNSMDVNDAGINYETLVNFPGTYTVDATGRGTLSLHGLIVGSGTVNFAIYVISAKEFYLILTDKVVQNEFVVAGNATFQQPGAYSKDSFNATGIFNIVGLESFPDAKVGAFIFDGNGDATMNWDENNGGQVQVGNIWSATYDMEINGRGTIHLIDPINHFDRPIWYLYATGPNSGLIMDSTSPGADIGQLQFQELTPPFDNSNISGTYVFNSVDPVSGSVPVFSGAAYFDGSNIYFGQGGVNGGLDENSPDGLLPNQLLTGTYSLSRFNNGRGSMTLTSPASSHSLWLISDSEVIALDIDVAATQPAVWHFQK